MAATQITVSATVNETGKTDAGYGIRMVDSTLRDEHAKADDDLCRIALPDRAPQYYVRGVLPVVVKGRVDGLWWGLWAEVTEATFRRIINVWTDPDQEKEPPFPGELANVIPSYVNTLGLRLHGCTCT